MNLSLLVLACFFLSGLAGLIYEVLWVRMIEHVIGGAPFAVATVLSVFMGGLALGSYLAGKRVDRLAHKRNLLSFYGKLEVGVGLYGLLLPLLIVMTRPLFTLAYNHLFAHFWVYNLFTFVVCGLLLLVPTALMGATLPVLCRFYVDQLDHVGARTGRLYGLNTIGAALGAMLAGFVLVKALGVWQTLFVAVGINLFVGCLTMFLGRTPAPEAKKAKKKRPERKPPEESAPALETSVERPGARWALGMFAVSGFCAMAYEVTWTRLLGLIIGPTTYSFTLVVATFIVGLAIGSLLFGMLGDRVKSVFGLLAGTQIGAALLALMVSHFLGNSQFFFAKLIYSFQGRFGELILVQSLLLFGVMLGPTILLGATFPLVNKLYVRSLPQAGRSIGAAYALNTLGAILGSLAAGFLLMPLLGKENALKLVSGLQFAFAFLALGWAAVKAGQAGPRWVALCGTGVLGLVLLLNYPFWNRQLLSYGRYHNFGQTEGDFVRTSWGEALWKGSDILLRHETGREVVFYGDGAAGFTTVEKLIDSLGTVKYTLINSGKPDASSHGDRSTQTLLAHAPMLFHPNPKKVMVLGLASGMTSGEILNYPVERVDTLEINREVVKACDFFDPWNNGCLSDSRSRIILQDGRNHLSLTRDHYDVIISEPSNPWMAGLANLYTLEFFDTVKNRLADDGIFVQWIHSYEMDWPAFAMVGRTFTRAFPHSLLMTTLTGVGDYLLVGFKGDRGFDPAVAQKNLVYASRSKNMSLPDARLLFHLIVAEDLKTLFGPGPIHTDNHPRLEFAAPRLLYSGRSSIEEEIARRRTLSPETKAIVEATSGPDDRLNLIEFSASVFSPMFGVFQPEGASDAQKERYAGMLETYCSKVPVSDYKIFPDRASGERCAVLQAEKIGRHLEAYPKDAPAYHSLGLAYMEMGEEDKAIESFRKATDLDPLYAKAYNNLGIAYMNEGELDKAREAFSAALSADPSHANSYFNLAQIALRRHDNDDALKYLREGLRYEDNPVAKQLVRRLLLE